MFVTNSYKFTEIWQSVLIGSPATGALELVGWRNTCIVQSKKCTFTQINCKSCFIDSNTVQIIQTWQGIHSKADHWLINHVILDLFPFLVLCSPQKMMTLICSCTHPSDGLTRCCFSSLLISKNLLEWILWCSYFLSPKKHPQTDFKDSRAGCCTPSTPPDVRIDHNCGPLHCNSCSTDCWGKFSSSRWVLLKFSVVILISDALACRGILSGINVLCIGKK